jgi:O-antigen ligase
MLLPTGVNSYSKYLYIVFLMSMCLLPFSTEGGEGSKSVVVTFAFPFIILLLISIIYNYLNRRDEIIYHEELKLTILLAILHVFSIFISSLMNHELQVSFARAIFHLFGFTIFLYVISNSSTSKNASLAYNNVAMMFILSGFIMSAYFIGNFLFAIQQNSLEQVLLERSKGGLLGLPWGVSNTIAGCLMMPLFSALDRIINVSREKTNSSNIKLTFFMMIIIIFAIILTQSRNAIIALMIGMIFVGSLTKRKKPIIILFIVVALILAMFVSFYSQELDGIFSARIGDGAADIEGFNGRTSVWEISLLYFSKHPFQPVGYFGMLGEIGHTAHNVFLTTLIEQGIVGLITYILFTINNFSFCINKLSLKYVQSERSKRRAVFYIISMFSILLQLQFEDSNLTAQNIIYQWIFLALVYLSAYCDQKVVLSTAVVVRNNLGNKQINK